MSKSKTKYLRHQAWVHRPRYDDKLVHAIDEGIDYCFPCAEIVASEYKKQFPAFEAEICACGGNDVREADSAPQCHRCHQPLSAIILGSGRYVNTLAKWLKEPQ